jgi:hypothetical protein
MQDETRESHDKDIKNLKDQIDALATTTKEGFKELRDDLRRMGDSYIQRKEVEKELVRIESSLKKIEDDKLDKKDFDPIRTTLSRLVWILITPLVTGIVGALIYLVGHFAK